jgi:lipopolysaccharide transport system permease protein
MNRVLQLATTLGWQDIKQAYRRSALGAFWITIGMAVTIATIGLVFSQIFKAPIQTYLPFLALGIITWGFISATLTDACQMYISSEAMIKQLKIPFVMFALRTLWKNTIALSHNLAILPIVMLVVGLGVNFSSLLAIPGLLLLIINVGWVSIFLGLISARYRDFPSIVSSLLTIGFYVSPVMWSPTLLPTGTAHILLGLNPVHHLLQVVRQPLLGQMPTLINWTVVLLFAVTGWIFAALALRKWQSRIAYWV